MVFMAKPRSGIHHFTHIALTRLITWPHPTAKEVGKCSWVHGMKREQFNEHMIATTAGVENKRGSMIWHVSAVLWGGKERVFDNIQDRHLAQTGFDRDRTS